MWLQGNLDQISLFFLNVPAEGQINSIAGISVSWSIQSGWEEEEEEEEEGEEKEEEEEEEEEKEKEKGVR